MTSNVTFITHPRRTQLGGLSSTPPPMQQAVPTPDYEPPADAGVRTSGEPGRAARTAWRTTSATSLTTASASPGTRPRTASNAVLALGVLLARCAQGDPEVVRFDLVEENDHRSNGRRCRRRTVDVGSSVLPLTRALGGALDRVHASLLRRPSGDSCFTAPTADPQRRTKVSLVLRDLPLDPQVAHGGAGGENGADGAAAAAGAGAADGWSDVGDAGDMVDGADEGTVLCFCVSPLVSPLFSHFFSLTLSLTHAAPPDVCRTHAFLHPPPQSDPFSSASLNPL